ncbi:uncharacterized protein LOC132262400 [Phlebotomus argentipes]|uniref:uncharacterized protein LOC132262400 n=1 Tax=Phlebotomus argentipes TaxID=94469 RepID=UPI0028931C73|nr:uncharacterized protein LOC132262400 [Phlebotomus argentipes]
MIQLLIMLAILAIYLYFKWHLSFFIRRGIVGPKPLPFVGNMWSYVCIKKHFGEVYDEMYQSYPEANYVGFFKMSQPAVLMRDLDIVKSVLAGDFSSFHTNDFIVDEKLDPLAKNNVFIATGDRWKMIRSQVSPLFTYPKVKACFPIIDVVRQSLVKYIESGPESTNPNGIEAKSLGGRFTTDVVASCAFGVEGQAFTDPNSDFRLMATSIFAPSSENMIKSFATLFFPQLISIFRVSFISKELDTWLRSIINQIIKRRDDIGERRQDFLQAFIDMRSKDKQNIFDEDLIVGQALTFITDGIETSSTLICYALYELARHPDVVVRIQEEIDTVYERHDGKMTEEGIMELVYMEQVLFETLRLHSAVFSLAKTSTKDFTFPPQFPDSHRCLTVPKGTTIIIPVNAIHHDSRHFPHPHTFDPNRFSEERKERHRYAFLGFGEGPRICLGQKFGLFQTKSALSAILRHFNLTLSLKSIVPPPVSKKISLRFAAELDIFRSAMLPYILLSAIVAIYLYFKWHLSFFERRGIAGPKPLPFIGNMWDYVTGKKHFGHVFDDIYRSYPNANYVGIYKMHKPAVLVKDLDVVKDVIVGDFSSFHDNDFALDPKLDPLSVINPFFAAGESWKELRAQVSPIFTFSKVKACFPIMNGVCNTLVDWIKNGPKAGNSDGIEVKSLGEMYTMDVVASAAFGVEAQSFTSVMTPFRELLMDMVSPTFINSIKNFITLFMPQLAPILGIPFVSKKHSDWVRSFVANVVKRRTELGEKRQDLLQNFLDMLKKAENGNLAKYADDLVPGQSLLFLAEGTETSSMLICFSLYQLARNPDIAKRAQEEVDSVYERHGGKLTEEGVTEMEYLEQILFETLRLHSVVFVLARQATKDYVFPPQYPGSSQRLAIPKGTTLIVPVSAIHYDSAYHPDPYTFNPDRFSEEGRKERNRYAFLGFGEGPRICIGQKFGLFQVKAAISSILRNFNISLNKKTHDPLRISKKSFMYVAEDGIWVNFTERKIVK